MPESGICEATPRSECSQVKVLFVMIDGLGDSSISNYMGKTPLEEAYTPTLNFVSSLSSFQTGLLDPFIPGLTCGSDTAHLSILGYPPNIYYRSRGAYETIGTGISMKPYDIAFKASFAFGVLSTSQDPSQMTIIRRRCAKDFHNWGLKLCEDLNNLQIPEFPEVEVRLQYATEHRCGVRLRSPFGFTDHITSTDPLFDNLPLVVSKPLIQSDGNQNNPTQTLSMNEDNSFVTKEIIQKRYEQYKIIPQELQREQNISSQPYLYSQALYSSDVTNALHKRIHEMLEEHPITIQRKQRHLPYTNVLLLRACAEVTQLPSFSTRLLSHCSQLENAETKSHLHANPPQLASIAPTAIISGLTQNIGFTPISLPSQCNGQWTSDILEKFNIAFNIMFLKYPGNKCKNYRNIVEDSQHSHTTPYSFVFLHVKGADEASHENMPDMKKAVIEKIDQGVHAFLQKVKQAKASLANSISSNNNKLSQFQEYDKSVLRNFILIVTGDHSTPCYTYDHGPDPVPFLGGIITQEVLESQPLNVSPDINLVENAHNFGESICCFGELGRITGKDVLPFIHSLQDKIAQQHH